MNSYIAHLAGTFAVLIWAAIPALVKTGSTGSNLSLLLMLRFLIASFLFLPIARSIWRKLNKPDLKILFAMSVVLGANFFFQGIAMQNLPASWYVVIFSLNPVLALIGVKTKMTSKILINIFLMLLGTVLFIDFKQVANSHLSLSFAYVFVGMLTWVSYTLLLTKIQKKFTDYEVTGLTQQLALISCFVIWLLCGHPTDLIAGQIPSIISLGVLTPLAYFLFSYCLRRNPAFGILSQYLEPVFGVLIGYLFLNESLSYVQIIGALLIVWRSAKI